jgi:hypothetical protein
MRRFKTKGTNSLWEGSIQADREERRRRRSSLSSPSEIYEGRGAAIKTESARVQSE